MARTEEFEVYIVLICEWIAKLNTRETVKYDKSSITLHTHGRCTDRISNGLYEDVLHLAVF